MDKYIYNEKNGLWYELQGDYYLPCLKLPEERTASYRRMGTAAFAVSEAVSQGTLLHSADKRQAEQIILPTLTEQAEEMFPRLVKATRRKGRRNGSDSKRKTKCCGYRR